MRAQTENDDFIPLSSDDEVTGGTEVPQRRRRPRYQVRVPVQIRSADPDAGPADAVITDISATGARIATTGWLALPEAFTLMIRPRWIEPEKRLQCISRWQMSSVVGVRFERQLPNSVLQEIIHQYGQVNPSVR